MAPPHGVYSPTAARALAHLASAHCASAIPIRGCSRMHRGNHSQGGDRRSSSKGCRIRPSTPHRWQRRRTRAPGLSPSTAHHLRSPHGCGKRPRSILGCSAPGRLARGCELDGSRFHHADERGDLRRRGSDGDPAVLAGRHEIELDRPATVVIEIDNDDDVVVKLTKGGRAYSGRGPHAIEASGLLTVSARRRDSVDSSQVAHHQASLPGGCSPPPHGDSRPACAADSSVTNNDFARRGGARGRSSCLEATGFRTPLRRKSPARTSLG